MSDKYRLVDALKKKSDTSKGERTLDIIEREGLEGAFKRKLEREEEERKKKEADRLQGDL